MGQVMPKEQVFSRMVWKELPSKDDFSETNDHIKGKYKQGENTAFRMGENNSK